MGRLLYVMGSRSHKPLTAQLENLSHFLFELKRDLVFCFFERFLFPFHFFLYFCIN